MTENNYKSLFILHVYFYCLWDNEPTYDIDKEEFKYKPKVSPGFDILELETGFYQTLADAEKRIRQLAKYKREKVYCSLVEEKPMDYPLGSYDRLSCRRYWSNGKLWQTSNVSNIYHKGLKRSPLGDIVFHGRDPKTILFEEGDIVEFVQGDFVKLAIVQKLPATVAQVDCYREQRQNGVVPLRCLILSRKTARLTMFLLMLPWSMFSRLRCPFPQKLLRSCANS